MAAFKFTLEKILDYRKQLEDQAKQALSAAMVALENTRKKIDNLTEVLKEEIELLSKPDLLDASERWLHQNYEDSVRRELESLYKVVVYQENQVNKCRQELTAKAQERELLEKLKEKQHTRYKQEELQKELRMYDETATLRFTPPSF